MPKKDPGLKRPDLSPEELLVLHKIDCGKVWAVWSPGESDFGPYETILFTDSQNKPRTAVLLEDKVVCRDGWDRFYVECY